MMSFFKAWGPKDGNGSRAAPIRLPQVTDLSLAGCSPAEPASVQAGKANMAPGKTACAAQCRSLQTHAPKKGKLTVLSDLDHFGGCIQVRLGDDLDDIDLDLPEIKVFPVELNLMAVYYPYFSPGQHHPATLCLNLDRVIWYKFFTHFLTFPNKYSLK